MKDFFRRNIYYVLGGLCLLAVGIYYLASRGGSGEVLNNGEVLVETNNSVVEPTPAPAQEVEPAATPEPPRLIVHIVGAVNSPGVFQLPEGARVIDVLEMANGATEDADLVRVNLAAPISDGMQIIIPREDEEVGEVFVLPGNSGTGSGGTGAGGRINVNTATAEQLQQLPGVGPSLSQTIVNFREEHGNFATVDELINVSGIGSATLERLRDLVTVN